MSLLPLQRRGRGPALVLLHGFTGTGDSLSELARGLEPEFETLAPDLPGHGRSAGAGPFRPDLRQSQRVRRRRRLLLFQRQI